MLRAHRVFDVERAGDCGRTDAVFLEQFLEVFSRPRAWWSIYRADSLEAARVQRSQVWDIDGGGLLTGEGGDVVVVVIRYSRVGSGVGIFISSIQWRRSLPVVGSPVSESGQKPLLRRVFGRASRVIAALRRWRLFELRASIYVVGILLTVVDHCGMLRCPLRVAGRQLSKLVGGRLSLDSEDQEFDVCNVRFYDQRLVASDCSCIGGCQPIQSRAASGTAAVVNISAGVDVASVNPRRSVATPGSASLRPPSVA